MALRGIITGVCFNGGVAGVEPAGHRVDIGELEGLGEGQPVGDVAASSRGAHLLLYFFTNGSFDSQIVG